MCNKQENLELLSPVYFDAQQNVRSKSNTPTLRFLILRLSESILAWSFEWRMRLWIVDWQGNQSTRGCTANSDKYVFQFSSNFAQLSQSHFQILHSAQALGASHRVLWKWRCAYLTQWPPRAGITRRNPFANFSGQKHIITCPAGHSQSRPDSAGCALF